MIEPCEGVKAGMLLKGPCETCGHTAGSHTYPSGVCDICAVLNKLDEIHEHLKATLP